MTGTSVTPTSEGPSDCSSEFEHVSLEETQGGAKSLPPAEKGQTNASRVVEKVNVAREGGSSAAQQNEAHAQSASSSTAATASPPASHTASVASPPAAPSGNTAAAQDNSNKPAQSEATVSPPALDPTVDLAIFGIDELGIPSSYKQGDASAIDGLAREAMKDLEDVSSKVAALATTAVHDVQKLWSAAEPSHRLTELSSGFKGWFGSLAASSAAAPAAASPAAPPPQKPTRSLASLQEFFQLPVDENILESFTCSLQQQLQCSHNSYTTGLQMVFPGILCITDVHLCFVGDDAQAVPPFKLPHKSIKKVSSPRPKKGHTDVVRVLRIDCSDGPFLVLRDFDGGTGHLDDALALIELKLDDT